jgi:hypothetical protein
MKKIKLGKELKTLENKIEDLIDIINQSTAVEKDEDDVNLNNIIDGVLIELSVERPENEDFMKIANSLEKLYKLKSMNNEKIDKLNKIVNQYEKVKTEQKNKTQFPWKELTVGLIGCFQIFMILKHEEIGPVISKAVGFVNRLRT